MKTFDERKKSVQNHIHTIRRRRRRVLSVSVSAAVALVLVLMVLFVPYFRAATQDDVHADNEYYPLILKLKDKVEQGKNQNTSDDLMPPMMPPMTQPSGGMNAPVDAPTIPEASDNQNPDNYHETTDNQVAGVIEADIIKRSDKYIYYLRNYTLCVYSIAGADSCKVGEYVIDPTIFDDQAYGNQVVYTRGRDMYLSQDCKTVTLVYRTYGGQNEGVTVLVNLDVTDPGNIHQKEYAVFSGRYQSSRMVDGNILLAYEYSLQVDEVDFDDPSTFVPGYSVNGKTELVCGNDIVCPDKPVSLRYMVLCMVSGKDLQVSGSVALMDYKSEMYVSENGIYLTRGFSSKTLNEEIGEPWYDQRAMIELTGISYGAEGMKISGTVQLEGSIKDQYSMDQHEGILRVVTSTNCAVVKKDQHGNTVGIQPEKTKRNVNLYCIDLASWKVRASVIGFAPDGEDAQSVRFDGVHAYVCTAEVITLTDPVYFFDLSDLDHITYTDTGTIDGYSTSLIQLGDGFLLGIGFGADRNTVKLEVYEEKDGSVVSVCDYQFSGYISSEYKSYFIDRERDLIGLGTVNYEDAYQRHQYILLHFDGNQLNLVLQNPVEGSLQQCRAVLADGFLYILGNGKMDFYVQKIG